MTELLRQVILKIERLPAEEQDAIAEAMQRELKEREWNSITSKPTSHRLLDSLAAEAREEDANGETEESGERW